jgi:hypothetical protein
VSYRSWKVVFSFSLDSRKFLIYSLITSVTHWFCRSVLFSLHVFEYFLGFNLLLRSSFILLRSDIKGIFRVSWILWDLFCVLKYGQFWRKFHELQKRMYVFYFLGEILCRYQPCLFDLMCGVALKFLFLIFCLDDLSIDDRGVFRSPSITVLTSICALRAIRVGFF